jgi:DNA polymerase-3 subunit delta'
MADPTDTLAPDAIEGWPLPEAQDDWYGGPAVERLLIEAYRGGRMHHAWLIGGPKGIGKATLAYRFARFALAYPDPSAAPDVETLAVSPEAPAARKIAAGSHPNLLTLSRPYDEKNKRFLSSLSIDEVRRTIPFFGSTAGEAGWRIAIVDSADDMNVNAANALLKILEEPPKRSLFLVLSHAPGRLLPTIRSRCRRLDLEPLPADAIERALARHTDADAEARRFAAEAGRGSLRRAIRFLDEDVAAIGRAFASAIGSMPELNASSAHALGDIVAQRGADEAFEGFQDLVFDWLARRARGEDEPAELGALPPAAVAVPLAAWAEVWEKVRLASAEVEALNLDRKQFVLTTLTMLARATRM